MAEAFVIFVFVMTLIGMWVSYLVGKVVGRREERTKTSEPMAPRCPCGHTAGEHKGLGNCLSAVKRPHYNSFGTRNGQEYVNCACVKYYGPIPITSEFFSPGAYVND